MTNEPFRIAFYRPGALSFFNPTAEHPVGGAETRTIMFAEGLSQIPGIEVLLIVQSGSGSCPKSYGAIHLVEDHSVASAAMVAAYTRYTKARLRSSSFPYVRFWKMTPSLAIDILRITANWITTRLSRWRYPPHLPRTHKLFAKHPFDAVVCIGSAHRRADILLTCRQLRIRSVLGIAADEELSEGVVRGDANIPSIPEHGLAIQASIASADQIFVQSVTQQRLLKQRFGRDATIIRNPMPRFHPTPAVFASIDSRSEFQGPYVLWIGRADRTQKLPLLGLDVARLVPEVRFVFVVNPTDPDVFDAVLSTKPSNVIVIERLSPEEADVAIGRSTILINTSSFEGFPNTFLQAARQSVPIVSLSVDPDEFLTTGGCGICATGDISRMASAIRTLWNDESTRTAIGAKSSHYVTQHFRFEDKLTQLLALCQSK